MYSTKPSERSRRDVTRAADGLRRIVQALRLSTLAIERRHGVSGAQLFVLQQLDERDGLSLAEIAERTRTDPSSVSVVVARLTQKRLLSTKRADDDRRRAEVTLTSRGRQLLHKAPEPAQSRLVRALESLPSRETAVLGRALDQLARSLGASAGAPTMFFESTPNERSRSRG
jgi:DNA-binding MarR family transcriptional regulator